MYRLKRLSEKRIILFEGIKSSLADIEAVVGAAVSHFSFDAPDEKFVGERGKDSPVGFPERPVEEGDVRETEAGTEADVENKDYDVVGGVVDVGISRYESEGFTLSEILCRKRLSKRSVSKCVVDASNLPQCNFSNLQHLPLTFQPEIIW